VSAATESPHVRFRTGLAEGVLLFQRCVPCGDAIFPPRVLCPGCGSTELSTEKSAGRGVVYSVTVLTPQQGEDYPVCLIDLDEGFRMMSTVHGVPAAEVGIGRRVAFAPETGETPRAAFEPASDA